MNTLNERSINLCSQFINNSLTYRSLKSHTFIACIDIVFQIHRYYEKKITNYPASNQHEMA